MATLSGTQLATLSGTQLATHSGTKLVHKTKPWCTFSFIMGADV